MEERQVARRLVETCRNEKKTGFPLFRGHCCLDVSRFFYPREGCFVLLRVLMGPAAVRTCATGVLRAAKTRGTLYGVLVWFFVFVFVSFFFSCWKIILCGASGLFYHMCFVEITNSHEFFFFFSCKLVRSIGAIAGSGGWVGGWWWCRLALVFGETIAEGASDGMDGLID